MQILKKSIDSCVDGRLLNAGQSCISAKRLIVVDKLYDQFLNVLEKKLIKKIMGDPKDDVDLGPMVSNKAREDVHGQVLKSIKNGADLIFRRQKFLIWKELLSHYFTFKC